MKPLHKKAKQFRKLEINQELIMKTLWEHGELTNKEINKIALEYNKKFKSNETEENIGILINTNYIKAQDNKYIPIASEDSYRLLCQMSPIKFWDFNDSIFDKIISKAINSLFGTTGKLNEKRTENLRKLFRDADKIDF